jgi:DNA modification methylase
MTLSAKEATRSGTRQLRPIRQAPRSSLTDLPNDVDVQGASATDHAPLDDLHSSLSDRDWTFATANTREGTHAVHPYPAKFIPQIPRSLIEALHPGDDTAVFDPFCGSGTTLVEAAAAGVPTVGIDVHPLACLISKVKVTPLGSSLENAARAVLDRVAVAPLPDFPRVDHWFATPVQEALAGIVASIDRESRVDVRDALRVAFSRIVVRVSRQESDTRYAAIAKNVTKDDVYEQFLRAAKTIGEAISTTWKDGDRPCVRIVNKNILSATAADVGRRVSLVVTSPPYPNAYEYWLYHKYRMYWLGMNPLDVRDNEIGARPHFFKKNPATADDFRVQMSTVFRLLREVVVEGGHVCFQVGNSKIHGHVIDNAKLLRLAAAPSGFENIETMNREIPLTRKAFNLSHARIREERILVFRRVS